MQAIPPKGLLAFQKCPSFVIRLQLKNLKRLKAIGSQSSLNCCSKTRSLQNRLIHRFAVGRAEINFFQEISDSLKEKREKSKFASACSKVIYRDLFMILWQTGCGSKQSTRNFGPV